MGKSNAILKSFKLPFILVLVITMLSPLINVAFAYSIKIIIDAGIAQDSAALKIAILIGAAVIFLYAVINYVTMISRDSYIKKVMDNYKNKVFSSVINKSYTNFSEKNSGSYISILTNNMKKIEEDYLTQYFNIVKNVSLMIFSLIAMFVGNWELALLILFACMIPMMITGIIGKNVTKTQVEAISQEQKYTTKIKDMLLGFLVIKSFHVEKTVTKEYMEENSKLSNIQKKQKRLDAAARAISELSGMLVFLVAFGGGMYMALNGHTTIGSVTAIVQLVNFVVMPLNEIGISVNRYKAGKEALNSIQLSDEEVVGNGIDKSGFESLIEFENVNFTYPGSAKEELILNNLNLKLEKGKKYALVGMSGSGKSTIMNLMLRFFELGKKNGKLLLDGVNVNDLSLDSIYKMMTIVQQNVYVFDNSLKANITLNEEFSDEKVLEAIELAGLGEFVKENPLGIEAPCGENGSLLSGGQKQRLSIARSLIRKTPILLMDEATSSLDKKTTYEVENSILNVKDLTSLIITHKLDESLLSKYDEILYIKNGEISERGNFNKLVSSKGDFYNLFQVASL